MITPMPNKHIYLVKCIIPGAFIIYILYTFGTKFKPEPLQIFEIGINTYEVLEKSLCEWSMKQQNLPKRRICPQRGIVTVHQGGRLGNQIWEYASVWAVARKAGLEPYVPRCIKDRLEIAFESLSMPALEEIGHCVDPNNHVQSIDEWTNSTQNIILRIWAIEIEQVVPWLQDIRNEFVFKKDWLVKSQEVLHRAIETIAGENCTFVGVHIRRTDYVPYLKQKYQENTAEVDFYNSAMVKFEMKFTKVVFVIVSDEPKWCWKQFSNKSNVYVTGAQEPNSPELDMAILASCNHTIIDYGTFGHWGALLAGGETIYFNITKHYSAQLAALLPNWYTI